MNKKFYILFIIIIFVCLAFSIFLLNFFYEPMHYKYHYEYIDIEGGNGISAYCYTQEDGRPFCRTSKKIYPVREYKKIREEK